MLDNGGWMTRDPAIEVGDHDFGACLGAIDANESEVLGSDGLDPGTERDLHWARSHGVGAGTAARFRPSGTSRR